MTIDPAVLLQLSSLQVTSSHPQDQAALPRQKPQGQNVQLLVELGIVNEYAQVLPGFSFDFMPAEEFYEKLDAFLYTEHTPGVSVSAIVNVLRNSLLNRSLPPTLYGEGMQWFVGLEALSFLFLQLVHQRDNLLTLEECVSPECLEEAKAGCQTKPRELTLRFVVQEKVEVQFLYNILTLKGLLTEENSSLHKDKQGFCFNLEPGEAQVVHCRFLSQAATGSGFRTSGESFQVSLTDDFLDKRGPVFISHLGLGNQWCINALFKLSRIYQDDESIANHMLNLMQNGYEILIEPEKLRAFDGWKSQRAEPGIEEMLFFCQVAAFRGVDAVIKPLIQDKEIDPTKNLWHASLELLQHISYAELEALLQVFGAISCKLQSNHGIAVSCTSALGTPSLVFRQAGLTFKVPFNLAQAVYTVSRIQDLSLARHLFHAVVGGLIPQIKPSPTLDISLPLLPVSEQCPYLVRALLSPLYPALFGGILQSFIGEEPNDMLFQAMDVAFMAQGLSLAIDKDNPVPSYINCLLMSPRQACKIAGQNLLVSVDGQRTLKAKWLPSLPEVCERLYEQLVGDPEATREELDSWKKSPQQVKSRIAERRKAPEKCAMRIRNLQASSPLTSQLREDIATAFAWRRAIVEHNLEVMKALLRLIKGNPAARKELLTMALGIRDTIHEQNDPATISEAAKALLQACRPDDSKDIHESLWPSVKVLYHKKLTEETTTTLKKKISDFLPSVGIDVLLDLYETVFSAGSGSDDVGRNFSNSIARLLTLSCESENPAHATRALEVLHTIYTQHHDFTFYVDDFPNLYMRLYLRQIQLNGWSECSQKLSESFRVCVFNDIGYEHTSLGVVTCVNIPIFYSHYFPSATNFLISTCPGYNGNAQWAHTARMNRLFRAGIERATAPGVTTVQKARLLDFVLQNMRNMLAHYPHTTIEPESFLQLAMAVPKDDPLYPVHVALVTLLRRKASQKGLHFPKPDLDEQAASTIHTPLSSIHQALEQITEENVVEVLTCQQAKLCAWQETEFVDEYDMRDDLLEKFYALCKRFPRVILDATVCRMMTSLHVSNTVVFGDVPMQRIRGYIAALREIYENTFNAPGLKESLGSSAIAIRCLSTLASSMVSVVRSKGYMGAGYDIYVQELTAILAAFNGKGYLTVPSLQNALSLLVDVVHVQIPARLQFIELFLQVIKSTAATDEPTQIKHVSLCNKMASTTVRTFEQQTPLSGQEALATIHTLIEVYKTCECGFSPHLRNKIFQILTNILRYAPLDEELSGYINTILELLFDPKVVTSLKGAGDLQATIFKLLETDRANIDLLNKYLPRFKAYNQDPEFPALKESLTKAIKAAGLSRK